MESWTLVKEHRDWAALELGWAANGGASAPQLVGLSHGGVRGNPCIFPAAYFPELLALTEDHGGSSVIPNSAARSSTSGYWVTTATAENSSDGTASRARRISVIVPDIQALLSPFLFLTSFNCAIRHSFR